MRTMPDPELLPVAVRAYAEPPRKGRSNQGTPTPKDLGPSEWTLIFDTETTTDSAQQVRIGAYQVRRAGELHEAGLFYDSQSLDPTELETLEAHASDRGLVVRTLEGFVDEVFFVYAYELRGTCVGLNLPFDLSRVAVDHGLARGRMRGGFSLQLSKDVRRPRVRVKHLNSRTSLIDFTAPCKQSTPRGMRNRGQGCHPGVVTSSTCERLRGRCSVAPGR